MVKKNDRAPRILGNEFHTADDLSHWPRHIFILKMKSA
ncbi:hypothetical protein ADG881_1642 [Alcanivorax sp. DG881]|nr:hypothetical protein ADG881_1642 [Alcanivorax sp. DG881]